jgi:hypothetical protein
MAHVTLESLTPAMIKALVSLKVGETNGPSMWGVTFQSLDALRRRGLLERYSDRVHKSVYARGKDEYVQFTDRKGHWRHEWWVTPEGADLREQAIQAQAKKAA